MAVTMNKEHKGKGITRRTFLKASAFVGGSALLANKVWPTLSAIAHEEAWTKGEYPLNRPENVIYSVCLNCHTACTLKGKVYNGVLVKIDGNPYSPMNLIPNLPQETPLAEAARVDAALCPKGQSGIQVVYDPYRLRKVLKRAGKRGENRWVAIEWDQFIEEVVNGGDLFGEGPVPGFKDVWKLRDPKVAKALAEDVAKVQAGEMTVDEFKEKHREHLDLLIDPDHPDLGPVNNQFVFMAGRIEHGRKELGKRFTKASFGSVNFFEHTTICEQSHHIAYKMATGKSHMKPDILNAKFVVFFGTGAFEANFGPTNMAPKLTERIAEGDFKYAVVDPRLSKTAGRAWKWLPIKPGTDGALAMGMIRWILENERYDRTFLENPNKEAAAADGETSHSDATWLVRTDRMEYLKASDAGLEVPEGAGPHVVMTDEGPALADRAEAGLLEFSGQVNGVPVKTVFTLLKERAFERSLSEYAEICGIPEKEIVELAREFTSHGKKAVAELYRGPVQHTNGYYNAQAIITLNVLIGNVDWKGGLMKGGGHWHEDGSKPGAPFPKAVVVGVPDGLKAFGVKITREGTAYEKTTLFARDGYPAKRPWYPFTSNVYQEIIPSAEDEYPYPIKILLIHKGTPAFASPAGHDNIRILRDPKKIPLIIACDVVIGETTMYADYILPDLTYLERWGTPHISPDVPVKVSKMRQPVAAPMTEIVTVDGEEMPISLEAFLIAVGKRLGLPGIGKDAFGPGWNFDRPEDYYLKLAANLAFGDKEDGSETLPPADEEEMRIFREARKHLPKAVFDEEKWKRAVPEELWPSVVYLLNRGGRFETYDGAYKGDKVAHAWKGTWHIFAEKVAKGKNSLTGEPFDGLPRVEPVTDAAGNPVDFGPEYDLHLITYKEVTGGQSRTASAYWLQDGVLPENYILMNRRDAEARGLRDGDWVRVISPTFRQGFELGDGRTYEVKGRVRVLEGMRPGVIAISWHYGHWAYGANDVEVDGRKVPGDRRRARGVCPNPAMLLDPVLKNVCLTDPIGGSASFYDTRVRIEKA